MRDGYATVCVTTEARDLLEELRKQYGMRSYREVVERLIENELDAQNRYRGYAPSGKLTPNTKSSHYDMIIQPCAQITP